MNVIESTKHIIYKTEDPISNLFIQISQDETLEFEYKKIWIKFSIKGNMLDSWFLIDSLNPLRVFGGAVMFCGLIYSIISTEQEIRKVVESWTVDDLIGFAEQSIDINLNNSFELYTPIDYKNFKTYL